MTATGTIKWFSAAKHYGFIVPDAGGHDVFLHRSVLTASNLADIAEGERVSFDVAQEGERTVAANLTLLDTHNID